MMSSLFSVKATVIGERSTEQEQSMSYAIVNMNTRGVLHTALMFAMRRRPVEGHKHHSEGTFEVYDVTLSSFYSLLYHPWLYLI